MQRDGKEEERRWHSREVDLLEADELLVRGHHRAHEVGHVHLQHPRRCQHLPDDGTHGGGSASRTWTTSLPCLSPVLCTVTETLKSSSVPIVDFDSVKSVL